MAKKKNKQAFTGVLQTLAREFNGMPVVDAKADLKLVVNSEEVASAIGNEKDPENCILALACRRQLRSSKLLFFKSVAYVHHPGDDGVDRVYRYKIGKAARDIIQAFDRKKKVSGNVTVTLQAPGPGHTLDYQNSVQRNWREKQRKSRKASIVGRVVGGGNRPFKKGRVKDITVRDGSGMAHFPYVRKAVGKRRKPAAAALAG